MSSFSPSVWNLFRIGLITFFWTKTIILPCRICSGFKYGVGCQSGRFRCCVLLALHTSLFLNTIEVKNVFLRGKKDRKEDRTRGVRGVCLNLYPGDLKVADTYCENVLFILQQSWWACDYDTSTTYKKTQWQNGRSARTRVTARMGVLRSRSSVRTIKRILSICWHHLTCHKGRFLPRLWENEYLQKARWKWDDYNETDMPDLSALDVSSH